MKKVLVIAEKPAQAKSYINALVSQAAIVKKDGYYEGSDPNKGIIYIVSYCVGHLIELAEPEEYGEKYAEKPWKVETLPIIPTTWKFAVDSDKRKQFAVLKKLLNSPDISEIVCGTDAGREGELIFGYVYLVAGCKNPNVKRLWIASLEAGAIIEGFNNLRPWSEFRNIYEAGLCRAKADWLIGRNGSRLFSAVYKANLSVGRVQTPTLNMLVERDNKIKNFTKEKYFTLKLDCGRFTATSDKIDNPAQAEEIKAACNGKAAIVTEIKKEQKTINPPKLYDLATLQREANRIYGYTADQTLKIAQNLYLKKYTTYPRVNSQYITEDMADSTAMIVRNLCSKYKVDNFDFDVKRTVNNAKVSDHHSIIPTKEVIRKVEGLTDDEQRILDLVILRLMCAVAKPHIYESLSIKVDCNGHRFSAKGQRDVASDSGYAGDESNKSWKSIEAHIKSAMKMKATAEDKDKDIANEKYLFANECETFPLCTCSITEHWTNPPVHYTDGTLLSAMETAGNGDYDPDSEVEKKGIGTAATRASMIEKLIEKGCAVRDGKSIVATEKGFNLIKIVPNNIKSPKLTAEWETELQKIERGEANADDFMSSITAFTKTLVAINATPSEDSKGLFAPKTKVIGCCPKCGSNVIDTKMAYSCEKGKEVCNFVLWKNPFFYTKTLTEHQARQLLENRRTGHCAGFKSKAGKVFDAYFILKDDNTLWFSF